MSVKYNSIPIYAGLIFSIIAGVGSYFTTKSDAETERAVMIVKFDYLTKRIEALEATKPELVAERVNVLGKTVEEMKIDQTTMLILLDEISNHIGS